MNPYPAYRPSGVEWLGDVPEHWETKRLKFVASINDDALSESEDPLRPISYVDIGSVDSTMGITKLEEMVFEDAPSRARRLVRDGDTIVSTVRTYLRAIAPVSAPPAEMVVSTGFAVIRPRALSRGFASWALREQGIVDEVVARSTGVSYPAINASEIGELPIPLPPLDEQRAIAAFLDRETERIDALVAKKRQLIERLREYRTALITRTVTRGLPPDAARAAGLAPSPHLKPSGVEWLGDVPEHWDVRPLKAVLSKNDGGVWGDDPDEEEPDSTLVLRSTEQTVDGGWSISDPARRMLSPLEKAGALLKAGDLVVTKSSGSELHIGKASLVTEDIAELDACFSNFMQRLRCRPGHEPRLVWYLLNSPVGRQQLVFNSNTTTGLANLNGTILGEVVAPVPPSRVLKKSTAVVLG